MGTIQTLLEILKYTIPAMIVLICSYMIVQKFLVAQIQRKQLTLLQDTQETTLRLRLQAYERLVLFAERIHPNNILPRVYDSSMNVAELQQVMVMTIRAEFEHNLSQQIYVSKNAWETIKNVKEQEINMVHSIAQSLDAEAPAKELHTRIINYVYKISGDGELPVEVALHILNEEVKRVLAYGTF